MDDRIAILRRILDESSYTVALCGSGMMEEGGFVGVKYADKAYDIERNMVIRRKRFSPALFTIPVRSSFLIFTKRK